MTDRWIPTIGYELAKIDGKTIVLRRGGKHVKPQIPDDEAMLVPVAEVVDYDEGVKILRGLRATVVASSPQESS